MNWLPEAIRDGILVVLVISGPLVMAAALIGLIIGILQAATQVQEQTIGSALKIIGVFSLMIALGFWMYQYLSNYTTKTLTSAFTFVPRQNKKAVPSYAFNERRGRKGELQVPQQIPIIKPEKLEATIPLTPAKLAPPPGTPVLGRTEIPKPPEIKNILPPQPKIPDTIPQIKPTVPLSDIEEPKPIPEIPENQQEDSTDNTLINENLWQKKELFSYSLNEKDPLLLNNSWIESK